MQIAALLHSQAADAAAATRPGGGSIDGLDLPDVRSIFMTDTKCLGERQERTYRCGTRESFAQIGERKSYDFCYR